MISSPLRYPGGKAKLYPFFTQLIQRNGLFGAHYCEPYAGGAGLAIRLLTDGFVDRISINDIDKSIFAFWCSALHQADKFCKLIEKTPVTVSEWRLQKKIWESNTGDKLALGFATYFLNRTNRSGIIEGAGPIGGYAQAGTWKIDARLVKDKQIENIQALSRFASQISVSNLDALHFCDVALKDKSGLVYLDPPYFVKGHKLYKNFYEPADHADIARELKKKRKAKWVLSYDDVPEIRKLYEAFDPITYFLNYSAGEKGVGTEVIYLSDTIKCPDVTGFRSAA